MTNDFNLNKIATLRGLDVVNLNDLAKSLRPVVLPGEVLPIKIVKAGEGPTQGVGYLDDGTMVVVDHARERIGDELNATVTSTLQTSAGRMIFARVDDDDTTSQEPKTPPPGSPNTPGTPGTGRNPRRSR